jgi:hypothetical protein
MQHSTRLPCVLSVPFSGSFFASFSHPSSGPEPASTNADPSAVAPVAACQKAFPPLTCLWFSQPGLDSSCKGLRAAPIRGRRSLLVSASPSHGRTPPPRRTTKAWHDSNWGGARDKPAAFDIECDTLSSFFERRRLSTWTAGIIIIIIIIVMSDICLVIFGERAEMISNVVAIHTRYHVWRFSNASPPFQTLGHLSWRGPFTVSF